nr:hypothetical protein [Bacillus licheniformis]
MPESTSFFQTDEALPYIRYVKEKISEENGVFVGNGSSLFGNEGYASLMGVPMLENNENKGFVIVLKKNVCSFSFEMFKLFQTLIRHSTLAVSNLIFARPAEVSCSDRPFDRALLEKPSR